MNWHLFAGFLVITIVLGLGRAWFMKSSRAKLLGRASGVTLIGGGLWLSLTRRPA
jgi:homoserine/homoserine lactone efflux protein